MIKQNGKCSYIAQQEVKRFMLKYIKKIFFLIIYVLGAVEGAWGNLATNNYNDPWNKWFKKSTNQL